MREREGSGRGGDMVGKHLDFRGEKKAISCKRIRRTKFVEERQEAKPKREESVDRE